MSVFTVRYDSPLRAPAWLFEVMRAGKPIRGFITARRSGVRDVLVVGIEYGVSGVTSVDFEMTGPPIHRLMSLAGLCRHAAIWGLLLGG